MINCVKWFLKVGLPLAFGIYLTWYFFNQMSEEAMNSFYRALREADYTFVALSLLLGIISYWSRAERWKYTLEPMGFKSNAWNRYHSLMIGYIVNLTVPRAGEASRALMLQRSDNIPFTKSFGTIITERIVDIILLALITSITCVLAYDDFWQLYKAMLAEFGVEKSESSSGLWLPILLGVILLGIGIVFLIKSLRIRFFEFAKSLIEGLLSIFRIKNPWYYFGHSMLIWCCYIVMFILPYFAFEETKNVPLVGIMLAFIAGSLGISFTNGGIGMYPLLVGFVTSYYLGNENPDKSLAVANALGMLIWGSQAILMLVMGLISLYCLPKNYTAHE
ncbi:MAG: flippase-like domain-containing protein [Bacteroidetes bacterium]|nr:flippase-like domain-containing protein [Bacteroidota bacterium]